MNDLNGESFFRRDGLATPLAAPDQRTTVGRNDDGSWYIEIRGPSTARAILTPDQMIKLCLGTLAILEHYDVTIAADWKRWTPPR